MRNATRRNRNIGTSKQGHGQNNKLYICESYYNSKRFYEQLTDYDKYPISINEHDFIIIVEKTRGDSFHACSIADIEYIIKNIPVKDYGDLKFIVLRQPKKKEEILSKVWGRLIYSYEFEKEYFPAIIIEAIDISKKFKFTKKRSVDCQKELERLKSDGHIIIEDKRFYTAEITLENVRNTQLYRTLLHEFGHYVHFYETVEKPFILNQNEETKEINENYYYKQIPKSEKEKFAHNYADKLRKELIDKNIIPFNSLD